MNSLLQQLHQQVAALLPGETVSIRENTLGLYGFDRRPMIAWLKERQLAVKFISETQTVEAKRPAD